MKESKILEKILGIGRRIIPKKIFKSVQPIYHYILAIAGAVIYRFPAKEIVVIGVTGTKGKSTVVELVNSILESAGKKTALASTIRYKIGDKDWRNLFKMTLRGRFFTQKFLREALEQGCTHAVIEMSSEGVMQSRHKFLYPDTIIFTNLAPEHIESHGSYENYVNAKLTIAKELENPKHLSMNLSKKHSPAIIVNADDKESGKFLNLNVKNKIKYSLSSAQNIKADEKGLSFQMGKMVIHSSLPGLFNVYNILAACSYAKFLGIPEEMIKNGIEKIKFIRGRMEKINCGQPFDAVVDYAHTPDSLKAAYEAYIPRLIKKAIGASTPSQNKKTSEKHHLICVLGSCGGGRDKWKRKEMGRIADKYCNEIILTNEDPYDENPLEIIEGVRKGINKKPVQIIMDRRAAIASALALAKSKLAEGSEKVAVLITGKGTDPYIMGPNGTKQEWDDATVVREELQKLK